MTRIHRNLLFFTLALFALCVIGSIYFRFNKTNQEGAQSDRELRFARNAIAAGDPVQINADGTVSAIQFGGRFFGVASDPIANGEQGWIRVPVFVSRSGHYRNSVFTAQYSPPRQETR